MELETKMLSGLVVIVIQKIEENKYRASVKENDSIFEFGENEVEATVKLTQKHKSPHTQFTVEFTDNRPKVYNCGPQTKGDLITVDEYSIGFEDALFGRKNLLTSVTYSTGYEQGLTALRNEATSNSNDNRHQKD